MYEYSDRNLPFDDDNGWREYADGSGSEVDQDPFRDYEAPEYPTIPVPSDRFVDIPVILSEPVDTSVPTDVTSEHEALPRIERQIAIDLGQATDSYEDFDTIYPEDVRRAVHDLVVQSALDATGNPLPSERLLVSGFDQEPSAEGLAATDAYRLSVRSAVPEGGFMSDVDEGTFRHFDGDDSNEANIIERDIQELRDQN